MLLPPSETKRAGGDGLALRLDALTADSLNAVRTEILAVVLGTILTRDRHGKSLLDRGLARIGWGSATRKGAHLYRSGPLGFALWGTHQLPGIAAQLLLVPPLLVTDWLQQYLGVY